MKGKIDVEKAKDTYCAKQGCNIDGRSATDYCKENDGCARFREFFNDFNHILSEKNYKACN